MKQTFDILPEKWENRCVVRRGLPRRNPMENEMPMGKKKVYVETTVVSDATALPTNDLVLVGRQITTREWWATARERFDLFISPIVRREAGKGDVVAAKRRTEALEAFPELALSIEASRLAQKLIDEKAVPANFRDDALHIAIAAVERMDYLVSWNFKHITNAQMIPRIKKVCADNGYVCAEICTPQMLQEEVQDEA